MRKAYEAEAKYQGAPMTISKGVYVYNYHVIMRLGASNIDDLNAMLDRFRAFLRQENKGVVEVSEVNDK